MNKRVRNRLIIVLIFFIISSIGVCIILFNIQKNIIFFVPPSKLEQAKDNNIIRVGGLVKTGSIVQITPSEIRFIITDDLVDLKVSYVGILPALFRENQGIVAKGRLVDNNFIASELITKHDEYYMPPKQ